MDFRTLMMPVLAVLLVAACSSEPELPPREKPPAGGQLDYQLGGAYQPDVPVKIVVRDRSKIVDGRRYNICYLNALQTQPAGADGGLDWWRKNHEDLLVKKPGGELAIDPKWEEGILDISTGEKRSRILEIQKKWIKDCKTSYFKGVEPDNLDSYTRAEGAFDLNATKEFMKAFVRYAHEQGLAVAQKNAAELGTAGKKEIGFDFAITEDCQAQGKCGSYAEAFGDDFFQIEYTDEGFRKSCADRGGRVSVIRRDRNIVPYGHEDYVYEVCPPSV
ncbi:endo alpha-1,4 polygalactosaminidase [Lentzea sp. HUAS12]|uniref:endo alpha-1,4 polygalactosaminidase n=1 Tax=Lentzea sp. HUAS12 TaxID=2951806 RepID=UPI0020A0ECAB|nr:endo alpha-1,4 polygalactosaminidase [Lentzea sp. HUAS12]USX49758.1 endo alpha-1,4 polygalactosaminidase [Lentzea sp. HUAS12]